MTLVRQRLCAENIVRIALTRRVRWMGGGMSAVNEARSLGEELGKGRKFGEFWWVGGVLMKLVRWEQS
jgi:hypothetical protein